MHAPRILIADDQADVIEALRQLLKPEGYAIESAASPAAVLEALEAREFDIVLMDLNYARDTTSGREGLDLLARIQALDVALPVVVMTAWGSVDLAVQAMRHGARDFVQKPRGEPAPLDHPAHAGRVRAGAAPRPAPRGGEPGSSSGTAAGKPHRRIGGHASRARADRARRPLRGQHPHHGRERFGEGYRRAGAACRIGTRVEAPRDRERWRPLGRDLRERAARARQGSLHGRQGGPRRSL